MKTKSAKTATKTLQLVYIIDDFHPADNEPIFFARWFAKIAYFLGIKDYYGDMGYSIKECAEEANMATRRLLKKEGLEFDKITFFARKELDVKNFNVISDILICGVSFLSHAVIEREAQCTSNAIEFMVERNVERLGENMTTDKINVYLLAPKSQQKIIREVLEDYDCIYGQEEQYHKLHISQIYF